jgi:hypothetical protein
VTLHDPRLDHTWAISKANPKCMYSEGTAVLEIKSAWVLSPITEMKNGLKAMLVLNFMESLRYPWVRAASKFDRKVLAPRNRCIRALMLKHD